MRKSLKKCYENNCGQDQNDLQGHILRMARTFEKIEFGYKPRRKNQMAHRLAYIAAREVKPILRQNLISLCNIKARKNKL
jgi:hypothetical protein